MDNLFNYFSWFSSKPSGELRLDIVKNDVFEMKDASDKLSSKVELDLHHTPPVLDRNTVMVYEKQFRDKFKKLGNLNQKCPYCATEFKSKIIGTKKCMECKKEFSVQKRVQDMATVAFPMELQPLFEMQWKCTSSVKKFKDYLPSELSYIEKQLEKQGKRNLSQNDIMHALIDAYAKNSLSVGHYQLYAAFMFYKAELLRSEQRFAEALNYYFYVHFLHNNGVSNSAEFKVSISMNEELKAAIQNLLDLGDLQIRNLKPLFDYSILALNKFNTDRLSVNMQKSYSLLSKEFRMSDAQKEGLKPMRSFVLYKKAC